MNDKLMYIPNEYDDIYDEHITKTTIIGWNIWTLLVRSQSITVQVFENKKRKIKLKKKFIDDVFRKRFCNQRF